MLHILATTAATLAALLPAPGTKPQPKPLPAPTGTIIVKVLPDAVKTDGDYAIDPGFGQTAKTPDERYDEMKKVLDERFAYMFELKNSLEKTQAQTAKKWDEYYVLRQAYEKQLKKLVADWVTDQQYETK